MHTYEPQLNPVEIASLRPTQMTVGWREVARKRNEWRQHPEHDKGEFLGRHMIPVVLGPKHRHYLIDHHHLVRALHEENVAHVLVSVVADLSELEKSAFWVVMDNRHWLHPYDADGKRQPHDRIPKGVDALADDPFRSLAGEVLRAGGYAKDNTPYSEFLWADFLRRRIDGKVVKEDFGAAVSQALDLARKRQANYLPGWCGPSD